jgi:hypothetical protein
VRGIRPNYSHSAHVLANEFIRLSGMNFARSRRETAVVNQDRGVPRLHMVRVLRDPSLPAFSQVKRPSVFAEVRVRPGLFVVVAVTTAVGGVDQSPRLGVSGGRPSRWPPLGVRLASRPDGLATRGGGGGRRGLSGASLPAGGSLKHRPR